jgi:hypothetical protein
MADKPVTIRPERVGRKIGNLDDADVARVNIALAFVMGLAIGKTAKDHPHEAIAVPDSYDPHYSRTKRSLSALPITDTELKLIAAAATIGLKSKPKVG